MAESSEAADTVATIRGHQFHKPVQLHSKNSSLGHGVDPFTQHQAC